MELTREEAKELFSKCKSDFIIDKIYDSFENRSCKNCKYSKEQDDLIVYCDKNLCIDGSKMKWHSFKDFCCNYWESK